MGLNLLGKLFTIGVDRPSIEAIAITSSLEVGENANFLVDSLVKKDIITAKTMEMVVPENNP